MLKNISKTKKKFMIGGSALLIIATFTMLIQTSILGPSLLSQSAEKIHLNKNFIVTEEAHNKATRLLEQAPTKTKGEIKMQDALMKRLENKETRFFFDYTLNFFGEHAGGINAAKFVALTISFDQTAELTELMYANKMEISKNSDEIMKALEERASDIGNNPYFENRMLNLVHQLDVTPERKIAFYGREMIKPLQVIDGGNLADESLGFEIALILAKQDNAASKDLASYIGAAIEMNKKNPVQTQALKSRVLNYYSDLLYLF